MRTRSLRRGWSHGVPRVRRRPGSQRRSGLVCGVRSGIISICRRRNWCKSVVFVLVHSLSHMLVIVVMSRRIFLLSNCPTGLVLFQTQYIVSLTRLVRHRNRTQAYDRFYMWQRDRCKLVVFVFVYSLCVHIIDMFRCICLLSNLCLPYSVSKVSPLYLFHTSYGIVNVPNFMIISKHRSRNWRMLFVFLSACSLFLVVVDMFRRICFCFQTLRLA